jgi:acetamidase/formamidase
MAAYHIEPERRTLHGHFSRDLPPVLTIDSGDTVTFRTLDAGWNLGPQGTRRAHEHEPTRKFEPRSHPEDSGHALCGPVYIRGAEPGMTLEIEIKRIVPGAWGWTVAGGWPHEVNRRLGLEQDENYLQWAIDAEAGTARDHKGRTVRIRPFLGVMGMPPDEAGVLSTAPPRMTGGNLDCKELTAGSRLFLPIAVPGGLFSCGDGHAAQGDGEASVTAIECPMDEVELTFRLRSDLRLATPRAETAEGLLTMGLSEDLNEATFRALDAMLDLLQECQPGLGRGESLALASVAVDLRITQIVNGVKGVHAVLPHGAIQF